MAAALYFADRDIGGAGKVRTQIAAVSGGLGITGFTRAAGVVSVTAVVPQVRTT